MYMGARFRAVRTTDIDASILSKLALTAPFVSLVLEIRLHATWKLVHPRQASLLSINRKISSTGMIRTLLVD